MRERVSTGPGLMCNNAGCPDERSRLVYPLVRRFSPPGRLFRNLGGGTIPRAVAAAILGTVAAVAGTIARAIAIAGQQGSGAATEIVATVVRGGHHRC